MPKKGSNRLIILTGPSCVGKTPLVKAFKRDYPEIWMNYKPLILYNDRDIRPGEADGTDYHFRPRNVITSFMGNKQYAVFKARNDWQAIDLDELLKDLTIASVFYEGNPTAAQLLLTHHKLSGIPTLSIFVSPFSKYEIEMYLSNQTQSELRMHIVSTMKEKQVHRAELLGISITDFFMSDVEVRANNAYNELLAAHMYDHVLPNHDGEDSPNWYGGGSPRHEASRVLEALVEILKNGRSDYAEVWEPGLFG